MKVSVEGTALKKALTVNKQAVNRRSHLPCLAGAKFETGPDRVTITTNDLDTMIVTTVPAVVYQGGTTLASVKVLLDLLKKPAKTVVLSSSEDGGSLEVANGATANIRTLALDDYPRDNRLTEDGSSYPLDLTAIGRVLVAAGKDDARPMLTGVRFDDDMIVATDSYRLHFFRTDLHYPKLLVPAGALAPICKAGGEATLYVPKDPHSVLVTTPNGRWYIRLIEGDFPNYKQLIPPSFPVEVTYDQAELVAAVNQVAQLIRESTTPVRLYVGEKSTRLQVKTQDLDEVTVEIPSYTDGPFDEFDDGNELRPPTVAFNPAYLAASVLAGPGPKVTLQLVDSLKPALIVDEPAGGMGRLLMPVRTSS